MQTESAVMLAEPGLFVAEAQTQIMPRQSSAEGYGRFALAAAMIGLGVLGLVTGDLAAVWQHLPIEDMPGAKVIAYACAAFELVAGVGLLTARVSAIAAPALAVFLLLWVVLLKLPAVIFVPQMLATWLGAGEIAVILAGAWVLYARASSGTAAGWVGKISGERGVRAARVLFAISLPTIGLAHFVYGKETAALVPPWLPFHYGLAYLTGAGSLFACIGILSGTYARLAASLEAGMMIVITLLVWMPGISPNPTNQFQLTGFLISSAIAAGAWVVADSYRKSAWLAIAEDA